MCVEEKTRNHECLERSQFLTKNEDERRSYLGTSFFFTIGQLRATLERESNRMEEEGSFVRRRGAVSVE